MGGFSELTVFLACVSLVTCIYATFVVLLGILDYYLLFLLFSSVLYGILFQYRVPKPKLSAVNHIFGKKWGAYQSYMSDDASQKNDFVMQVVGHRACGLDAPENSLSALKKVFRDGLKAIEFDVVLTADDVPVVFHDDNLKRMTDINKAISEMSYNDVQLLDISIKHPFGDKYTNERIPTLVEFVNYCIENDVRMFIDLKGDNEKLVSVINQLFKQFPKLYELAVVSSFNLFLIYQIRRNDPEIVSSIAWRPFFYSHNDYNGLHGPVDPRTSNPIVQSFNYMLNNIHQWLLWHFAYYVIGLSAVLLHKDMITRETVHYWSKRDIRVIAWSVNLPSEKQYFEKSLQITYLTDTLINS